MTYTAVPGDKATLVLEVFDKNGQPKNLFGGTFSIYDASNTLITSGSLEQESAGVYLAFWDVPSGATLRSSYKVVFTVSVTATGRTKKLAYLIEIRSTSQ